MPRDGFVIVEILVVSVAWLLLSLLFCGVGALARRAFGARIADEGDVFFDWWVGWALTVAFLLAWHFMMPITAWAFIPLFVAGVSGAWLALRDSRGPARVAANDRAALAVPVLLAWLALAAMTVGPDKQYDTGLYHLQSVRWAQAYAVVPGLANIDFRLAMNSSFFLFVALVENVRIFGSDLRLASGLLFLPLILQGIVSVHAAAAGRREMDAVRWFQVLMIPIALWQAHYYVSSMSPDGVTFVLAAVLSAELLRVLRSEQILRDGDLSRFSWDYRLFGMALLAVVGVTVKVSFAIFAIGVTSLVMWKWLALPVTTDNSVPRRGASRLVRSLVVIVPAIVIGALWMAHGVILSGYVAYPSRAGAFPVDWRVPVSVVQTEADWIVAWARNPGVGDAREVLGSYDWVPRWLRATARNRDVIGATIALMLAGVLRFAGRKRRQRSPNQSKTPAIIFLLPSLLYMAVWLFTAPAVRFALGPLWVIATGTLALSLAASGYAPLDKPGVRGFVLAGLSVLLATACAISLLEPVRPSAQQPVRQVTTLSGLTVNMPVNGDRCGDAPLPCSSQVPNRRLELRKTGAFASGFRIAK